jgi:hypothetical protein
LRLRSLPLGARPLLLRRTLLAFLGFPLSPACLAAEISLSRIDCLCVWPDECTSFSDAAVSLLVTTLPRAAGQYLEPLACRRPFRPTFSAVSRNVAYACWCGPR